MRKIIFPLIAVGAALWITGCAGPEEKLGRGLSNSAEIVRLGEMRRTIECESVLRSPDEGYTTGVIRGFNRSLERTGLGLYEVVTFPIPNHDHGSYEPIATKYFAPNPVYPESYKPGLLSDPLFDTDTFTGFSGGDIAPFVPGSRFKVFDN
jgi:putative exosortase-associated protein (TIGR04073 family)